MTVTSAPSADSPPTKVGPPTLNCLPPPPFNPFPKSADSPHKKATKRKLLVAFLWGLSADGERIERMSGQSGVVGALRPALGLSTDRVEVTVT